jgi:hypothetical protein
VSSPTIIGMPEVLCGVDNIERREGNVTAQPSGGGAPSMMA